MATTREYIEFVCAQVNSVVGDVGAIDYRKMFGEYLIYVSNKPLLLVCDNCVFVKPLPCVAEELKNAPMQLPYEGAAKEYYMLDVDDVEQLARVVRLLEPNVAIPKPRTKRKKSL